MAFDEFLAVVGSVASIASIPLAIYLYLRSRSGKLLAIRREIAGRLALQVGEGRPLTLFEVRAVRNTRLREAGIEETTIPTWEIVEQLVADTMATPLLDSSKKEEIIGSLLTLHQLGQFIKLYSSREKLTEAFKKFVESTYSDEQAKELFEEMDIYKLSGSSSSPAHVFGIVVSIVGTIAATLSILNASSSLEFLPQIFGSDWVTSLGLGLATALVAGGISYVLIKRK